MTDQYPHDGMDSMEGMAAAVWAVGACLAALVVIAIIVCGCASTPAPNVSAEPMVIEPTGIPADTVIRRAVCVGLLNTASGDKPCEGTDVDARTVAGWMPDRQVTMLQDAAATIEGVKAAIRQAAEGMDETSLLVLSLSGHGTRRRDASGDEDDGKDEGLVLWDGTWWDDEVWELICSLPPCRIEIITDTCHAEGNWRTVLTLGLAGPRYVQMELGLDDTRRSEWGGQLIQYAGCREDSYSYGTDEGGTLTQTMDITREAGMSRAAWFRATAAWMPAHQRPVLTHYNATEAFIRGEALQ